MDHYAWTCPDCERRSSVPAGVLFAAINQERRITCRGCPRAVDPNDVQLEGVAGDA